MLLKKVLFGAAIGLTLVATTALGSLDVPAGAQASDTVDLGGQTVRFDATNQTVEPAGLVGSPMDVGSTLTYPERGHDRKHRRRRGGHPPRRRERRQQPSLPS